MKQEIQMAAKLYRCHDTVKRLWGKDYKENIGPYIHFIETWNRKHGTDTMVSVTKICEDPSISTNGMMQLILLAAVVEIVEPQNE